MPSYNINKELPLTGTGLQMNKYLPVALLYVFFNSFLLPQGLLYTSLLTPVMLVWLYRYPSFNLLWYFFLVTIPFAVVHLIQGVVISSYLKSYILLFTVYVFALGFYQFLKNCHSLGGLFRSILLFNCAMTLVALVALVIPPLSPVFWSRNELTYGVNSIRRLKMLTYEASYYSFILAPIALYYYIKALLFPVRRVILAICLITFPILLSLSFGVISMMLLALLLLVCSNIRVLYLKPNFQKYLLLTMVLIVAALFVVLQFFPDNVVFLRIENVFRGRDSSFSGRTFDSIYLGWKIAAQKSIFFGAGAGQTKHLGLDLFNEFYNNDFDVSKLTIPNSIGDLLAQFGLLGLFLKLGLEIFFFFRTRVYLNYYRLGLFLFIFIYQFTGSFINNVAEYAIWLLAFSPHIFPEFNKALVFRRLEVQEDIEGGQNAMITGGV